MISEDLTGLFAGDPAGPAPKSSQRTGRILTFDPSTGNNTVLVGATTLTNVPMLQTGTEVGIKVGDVVLLTQIGYTYIILGRISTPGGSSFAAASVLTMVDNKVVVGFAVPVTIATLATINFTTPSWANTVSVLSVFAFNGKDTFGADTDLSIRIVSDGEASNPTGLGSSMTTYGHNGSFNGITMGHAIKHTVTSGQVVTINGQGGTTGGWTATAQNSAYLSCLAIFTKS